jgi:hypothetical protein
MKTGPTRHRALTQQAVRLAVLCAVRREPLISSGITVVRLIAQMEFCGPRPTAGGAPLAIINGTSKSRDSALPLRPKRRGFRARKK